MDASWRIPVKPALRPHGATGYCPAIGTEHRSAFSLFPGARYNLILVLAPYIAREEFEKVAGYVRDIAPDVQTAVVDDAPTDQSPVPPELDLPTMTFAPAQLESYRPFRGTVFQGRPLTKSQEYTALGRAGVPVPRWAVVTPDSVPDLSEFGPYVVFKPDRSGKGADVRIMRKGRVRWRPPETDFTKLVGGPNQNWLVQEFVYTGPWPVSYRVTTLFGEPLFAVRVEADRRRPELSHRYDFGGRPGVSIASSGAGCVMALTDDPRVLSLAAAAHAAFRTIPLLGVDILEDAETGKLYVLEVNAVGYTWHFSSRPGLRAQREFGFDFDAQFDGRRKAARILVEQVRRHAR